MKAIELARSTQHNNPSQASPENGFLVVCVEILVEKVLTLIMKDTVTLTKGSMRYDMNASWDRDTFELRDECDKWSAEMVLYSDNTQDATMKTQDDTRDEEPQEKKAKTS